MEKTCPRCQVLKSWDAFAINRKTGKPQPYCKPCALDYKRARYAASPEVRKKAVADAKRNTAARAPEVKEYQDAYRAAHRAELNALAVLYRQQNAELIHARSWAPERREKIRANLKAAFRRRIGDPEKQEAIRQHHVKATRKYYQKHYIKVLESAGAASARRRAIRKGAEAAGFDDKAHYRALEINQNGLCVYCAKPYGRYHRDHIVPLSRGGAHTPENLVLTCGPCNRSKQNKILWTEWTPPLARKTETP